MRKDLNKNFSNEDTETADKHIKKCLTLLFTRKMQIKQWDTTSQPLGWLLSKKHLCTVGGNTKWGNHYRKQKKNKKHIVIPLLAIYPK